MLPVYHTETILPQPDSYVRCTAKFSSYRRQSGHWSARGPKSCAAFDPPATLAVHCGTLQQALSVEGVQENCGFCATLDHGHDFAAPAPKNYVELMDGLIF
jgi:hypothetical protein